jgi:hypothetical protein
MDEYSSKHNKNSIIIKMTNIEKKLDLLDKKVCFFIINYNRQILYKTHINNLLLNNKINLLIKHLHFYNNQIVK